MVTPAVNTIIKMIEQLPEADQERVAEHLREHLADLEDDEKWDQAFAKSQDKLIQAAREARKQLLRESPSPWISISYEICHPAVILGIL